RHRPPFFNPSADPIRKTNPPPRQRSLIPVAQKCNQNTSAPIYAPPMYFTHALIGLKACVPVGRLPEAPSEVIAGGHRHQICGKRTNDRSDRKNSPPARQTTGRLFIDPP